MRQKKAQQMLWCYTKILDKYFHIFGFIVLPLLHVLMVTIDLAMVNVGHFMDIYTCFVRRQAHYSGYMRGALDV